MEIEGTATLIGLIILLTTQGIGIGVFIQRTRVVQSDVHEIKDSIKAIESTVSADNAAIQVLQNENEHLKDRLERIERQVGSV